MNNVVFAAFLGGWEILVILAALLLPVVFVGVVVLLIVYFSRGKKNPVPPYSPTPPIHPTAGHRRFKAGLLFSILAGTLAVICFGLVLHNQDSADVLNQPEFFQAVESNRVVSATIDYNPQTSPLARISGTYKKRDQFNHETVARFVVENAYLSEEMQAKLLGGMPSVTIRQANTTLKKGFWTIIPLIIIGLIIIVLVGLALVIITVYIVQRTSKNGKMTPVPPVAAKTEVIPRRCPQCGAELKPDAPEGLCPACLLQRGIATEGGAPPGTPPFVPPTVPDLARLFPQLEILELIGKGGMGAVYKARQPALDRLVALKILAPRSGSDLDFAGRFTREARALAKLSHPNIVGVYDFGVAAGQRPEAPSLNYFIMEYVDGPNLRQVEQGGKLSPREALEIIPQICAALQFAHDEGIVHRDIKPENVLLDKKGRVKIADFGLAKILGQELKDFRLTGARDVVGTPHYMAPEQVEKPQEVDHRADIYSLGVVFYEMLTGELPLGKFSPPSQRVQVDVRLDEVVMRSLEKEPQRRYQHASDVKTRVETISGNPAPAGAAPAPFAAAPVPAARRDSFWKWFAVIVSCAVVIPIIVAILGMLAAIAIPNFVKARERARLQHAVLFPPGLVARWSAENSAADSVGNNHGVLLNGVDFAAGVRGRAFQFNGGGACVKIPQTPALDIANQITIEFWMRADSDNEMQTYQGLVTSDFYEVEISNGLGGQMGVNFGVSTTDNLPPRADGTTGPNNFTEISSANGGGAPVTAGAWHHVAGTYDGIQLQLYIDGQPWGNPVPHQGTLRPMGPGSFVAIGSEDGRLTCADCPGHRYFKGLIDEVGIYNRALTAGEIQAIYRFGVGNNVRNNLRRQAIRPALATGGTGLPNLVANGDFETPRVPLDPDEQHWWQVPVDALAPWQTDQPYFEIWTNGHVATRIEGNGIRQYDACYSASGEQNLEILWDNSHEGAVRQTVPTVTGQCYRLIFFHTPRPGMHSTLTVSANSHRLGTFDEDGTALATFRWRKADFTFTADSDSTTLKFFDKSDTLGAGTHLDAVELVPADGNAASDEKSDLQKTLTEAKDLMESGQYEESLRRYVWYFDHSRNDAGQKGVRLSFALSGWIELGRRYPRAKQALVEIRDGDAAAFAQGQGYFDLFQEIHSLNQYLNDDNATVALFGRIESSDPPLAQQCFGVVEGLLVDRGEYQRCLDYIGDPHAAFDSIRQSRDRMKQWEDSQAAMREQQTQRLQALAETNSAFANLPRLSAPVLPRLADKNFVGQTRQLIEILVGANRRSDAEKIRDEALSVLDDPQLKSSVEDAADKIRNRSARAGNS